jgi:hypothetical protein
MALLGVLAFTELFASNTVPIYIIDAALQLNRSGPGLDDEAHSVAASPAT